MVKTVFVGGLSDHGSEEELRQLMTQAGQVATVRFVVDNATGKRKGFGFCEYLDEESAESAVANLDGADFYGRSISVKPAASDTKNSDAPASRKRKGGGGGGGPGGGPAGAYGPDPIAAVINGTADAQLHDLVACVKQYVDGPSQLDGIALLHASRPLVHALHLALDRLTAPPPPPPQQMAPPPQQQPQAPMNPYAAEFMPQPPQHHTPPPQPPPPTGLGAAENHPTVQRLRAAGIPVEAVLALSPAQLEQLPPDQRAQMAHFQAELHAAIAGGPPPPAAAAPPPAAPAPVDLQVKEEPAAAAPAAGGAAGGGEGGASLIYKY